jgi:hypothetical protein
MRNYEFDKSLCRKHPHLNASAIGKLETKLTETCFVERTKSMTFEFAILRHYVVGYPDL